MVARPAPVRTVFVHEYVTGGGLAGSVLPPSWAAEGGAMRRALAGDFAGLPGVRVVMTLDERLPAEPGPWETVRVGPGHELETFGRLAAGADSTALIAPEPDGVLLRRAGRIGRVGGRSLGSAPGAIALTGNKLDLARHWERHRVPTPPTRRIDPADWTHEGTLRAGAFPYPVVVKPIDGAGSIDTYYLTGDEVPPAEAAGCDLIQPFVPGTPMSAAFLVDSGGRAHLVGVARQRIALPGGRFTYLGGTVPAGAGVPLGAARRAVACVPGLRGWVGVDFVWDDAEGRITLLEINPRPTTSYVGFRRLLPPGELAAAWLDAAEGRGERAATLAGRIAGLGPVNFAADGTILSRAENC